MQPHAEQLLTGMQEQLNQLWQYNTSADQSKQHAKDLQKQLVDTDKMLTDTRQELAISQQQLQAAQGQVDQLTTDCQIQFQVKDAAMAELDRQRREAMGKDVKHAHALNNKEQQRVQVSDEKQKMMGDLEKQKHEVKNLQKWKKAAIHQVARERQGAAEQQETVLIRVKAAEAKSTAQAAQLTEQTSLAEDAKEQLA